MKKVDTRAAAELQDRGSYRPLTAPIMGRRLLTARLEAGFSSGYALTKVLGMKTPHPYYRLEKGDRLPSAETLHKLIHVAGLNPDTLLAPVREDEES